MINYSFSEEELRNHFLAYFTEINQKLICEVPVFCRSIDVVKYDTVSHELSAIEFKLSDWKRAINQAIRVGLCFDYLEICVPKPKTGKAIENIVLACTEKGIGLYFYTRENSFEYKLKPKQMKNIWHFQKENVISYVKETLT